VLVSVPFNLQQQPSQSFHALMLNEFQVSSKYISVI
jgi:hypothetical protein